MFQITIFFLYLVAATAFALSRLPQHASRERPLVLGAFFLAAVALVIHARLLLIEVTGSAGLALTSAVSMIGVQLALIGLLGALDKTLRGLSAGLLLLAAVTGIAAGQAVAEPAAAAPGWQMQTHILTSMFAYGLLTVGAIVAVYALVQENRLRRARLSPANNLFAPLETTEKLLNSITLAGFIVLALSVISGFTFVEDLFAQHLVHKTVLSLLALLLFGVLLAGRRLAGWRGTRAVYLYLAGFAILGLAYFGSRYILEELLGRSWG